MTTKRKAPRTKRPKSKAPAKRWSQRVTQTSNAIVLDPGVFSRNNPRSIALSLKRSADRSLRRKADPAKRSRARGRRSWKPPRMSFVTCTDSADEHSPATMSAAAID
jgi:hypothetical protein